VIMVKWLGSLDQHVCACVCFAFYFENSCDVEYISSLDALNNIKFSEHMRFEVLTAMSIKSTVV
jgi:hypothetical protein